MKKKKITILITGVCGFIGSHTLDLLLKKNFKVVGIDNLSTGNIHNIKHNLRKFKFIHGDINNISNFKIGKIDIIIHLAALADIVPSIDRPLEYFKANIEGTIKLLEFARSKKIKKFIYSASGSCYGDRPSVPTSENSKIDTKYPYALTKNLGEQILIHWSKVYKIRYISLRFFNVYGPRSRTNSTYGAVIGVFLSQKLRNYPFTIVGTGKQKRDFLFVSDAVNAIFRSINSKKINKIYNVGSGSPSTINYLAKLIGGKKTYIPWRPGEPNITQANITKIKRELKWYPKVKIEEGINIVIKNIKYWKRAPLWSKNKILNATKNWYKYLK